MKKVLVCEDEDSIREFVVINLKRSGYEVVDVNCGEEALKVFEEQGNFDVALLDIMMPGIDGMKVCKKIREKNTTMGIIMLSAKSQEMDKISSLMIGADDYITKPFSISELIARVDAVCRRVGMSHVKPEEQSLLTSGPFTLNLKSRTVFKNFFKILCNLMGNILYSRQSRCFIIKRKVLIDCYSSHGDDFNMRI